MSISVETLTYPPMGPGSLEVKIPVDFKKLKRSLVKAGHPLAYAPQWIGKKYFIVFLRNGEELRVMTIVASKEEEAMEIATANGRPSRNNPGTWEPIKALLVQDNPNRALKLDVKVNGLEE